MSSVSPKVSPNVIEVSWFFDIFAQVTVVAIGSILIPKIMYGLVEEDNYFEI